MIAYHQVGEPLASITLGAIVLIVAIFLCCGCVYIGVRYVLAELLAGMLGLGLVLVAVLGGATWLENRTGVTNLLIGSWEWLSGAQYPGPIIHTCTGEQSPHSVIFNVSMDLVTLMLIVAAIVFMMATIVGIPLGLVTLLIGSVQAIQERETARLVKASSVLAAAAGGVLVVGILLRIARGVSGLTC